MTTETKIAAANNLAAIVKETLEWIELYVDPETPGARFEPAQLREALAEYENEKI